MYYEGALSEQKWFLSAIYVIFYIKQSYDTGWFEVLFTSYRRISLKMSRQMSILARNIWYFTFISSSEPNLYAHIDIIKYGYA